MSPLTAAVISLATPILLFWLLLGVIFMFTRGEVFAMFRLFTKPAIVAAFTLVSLCLYHLLMQA